MKNLREKNWPKIHWWRIKGCVFLWLMGRSSCKDDWILVVKALRRGRVRGELCECYGCVEKKTKKHEDGQVHCVSILENGQLGSSRQVQCVQKTWRNPERSNTLIRLWNLVERVHRVLRQRQCGAAAVAPLWEQMSGGRLGCLRFAARLPEQKLPPTVYANHCTEFLTGCHLFWAER